MHAPAQFDPRWIRNGLSHLQLYPPSVAFPGRDRGSGVGFTSRHGIALVPGPPVGPPEAWPALVGDFERFCRDHHLRVAFCGVGPFGRERLARLGYRSLKVGDEAVLHLDPLDLRGRHWRECRSALNRARRAGIAFDWIAPQDLRGSLHQELLDVSAAWLSTKRLPELRFPLGTEQTLSQGAGLLAIARSAQGDIIAFATWVPVPQQRGWMLDLMRYRPGIMAGLMDALIVHSLLAFRARGYRWASLGTVPGSNAGRVREGSLRRLLDLAYQWGHGPYQPRSLFHFKSKFNPAWQPVYLACQPEAHLIHALLALMSASLPATALPRLLAP